MDNRSSLIEKLLQPADSNALGSADINKLCDIIRETSFEIHKFLRGVNDFSFCAFCAFLWLEFLWISLN